MALVYPPRRIGLSMEAQLTPGPKAMTSSNLFAGA
jgi:hypothetical protein